MPSGSGPFVRDVIDTNLCGSSESGGAEVPLCAVGWVCVCGGGVV